MKHTAILLLAVLMFTACELHYSDNGTLDGYWQLSQMDTLSTNRSADMRSRLLFWGVQHDMLEICDNQTLNGSIIFRFHHHGDTLILSQPIANIRDISDSIVTNPQTVQAMGLRALTDTFRIEALGSERMILNNTSYRFHFRRY